MIGFRKAYERTLSLLLPLEGEEIGIEQCIDRVLAVDTFAKVDFASVDASLKDNYAVCVADIV